MPETPISPLPDKDSEERFLTREEAIAELRALWEEGIASGPSHRTWAELRAEMDRRIEAARHRG